MKDLRSATKAQYYLKQGFRKVRNKRIDKNETVATNYRLYILACKNRIQTKEHFLMTQDTI